jgi:hypothetical protein
MELSEPDPNQLDLFTEQVVDSVESFMLGLDWFAEPAVLTLFGKTAQGETIPMLRIKEDMSLEYGPHYTPDEAAALFWQALQVEGKTLVSRLLEATDVIEDYMQRAERSSSCYIIADAERDALRRENRELKLRLKTAGLK